MDGALALVWTTPAHGTAVTKGATRCLKRSTMADHRTVLNRAECAVPLLRRGSVVIYDPPFNVDTVLMRRLAVGVLFMGGLQLMTLLV